MIGLNIDYFSHDEKDWARLKTRQEPSPGRIICKGTHSHTQSYNNMSIPSKFIISIVAIKYTKLQNYESYSLSVELINSCTASKTLYLVTRSRSGEPYSCKSHET